MAKKTAIRQLAKFLPKSIVEDFARAAAIDERENFVEAQVSAEEQIKAEAGSEVVDAAFENEKGNDSKDEQIEEPEFMKD